MRNTVREKSTSLYLKEQTQIYRYKFCHCTWHSHADEQGQRPPIRTGGGTFRARLWYFLTHSTSLYISHSGAPSPDPLVSSGNTAT